MKLKHLKINTHCDCQYPITWVAENKETCRINRNYKERHEPTYNGISISVQLPGSDLWAEFAANDEGWMYVADWDADDLPEIAISDGIREVEENVNRILKELLNQ